TVTLSANFLSTTINGTLVFSAALKTLNAANTLMVAGDTLRVKKSADPINTGLTSTWTHGSNSLTLSSSPTMLVDDCGSAYTFAQEWTSTWTSTSWSTFHSDGYNSSWNTNIESVSGLTGGKRLRMQWYWGYGGGTLSSTVITNYAAQKAAMDGNHVVYYRTLLQTLDLSNYTRISAWMSVTNSYPSYFGTVKLRLCSDAYGQTPVATFTIPNKSTWLPTVLTNMVNGVETPIGSGINSISIAVEGISLPASRSTLGNNPQLAFYMDNMIACLPASNASAWKPCRLKP
ncbi:MAG: hypothetical protein EBV30_11405, partial [Actinobacteria bacterium]|nr:hypothetical protein [Actinomycetota bacterium]